MCSEDNVLVIAAHPDDEVLGAGGYISKLSSSGRHVTVAIVSPRSILSRVGVNERYVERLKKQANKASKVLGVEDTIFGGFDKEIAAEREVDVNQYIGQLINQISPDLILTHPGDELHNDHNIINKAVSIATRPRGGGKLVKVIHFEQINVYPPINFWPNLYVCLNEWTLKAKLKAMQCYENELQIHQNDWRTLDGIKAKATIRGLECGNQYAEAFRIFRCYL